MRLREKWSGGGSANGRELRGNVTLKEGSICALCVVSRIVSLPGAPRPGVAETTVESIEHSSIGSRKRGVDDGWGWNPGLKRVPFRRRPRSGIFRSTRKMACADRSPRCSATFQGSTSDGPAPVVIRQEP